MKNNNKIGKKYDEGKWRFSLLPFEPIIEIIKVLEHGCKKYGEDNWKFVYPKKRYFDACMRHLTSWIQGEKIDKETGLNHLAHAGCCILFLLWNDIKKLGNKNE